MKTALLLLLWAGIAGTFAAAPGEAANVFSDKLCPGAASAVTAYDGLVGNPDSPVVKVIETANDAVRAYDTCATAALSVGAVEGLHYAQVRSGQYHFAIGHLLRLTGESDQARKSLQVAIELTKETIDWTSASQSVYRSNGLSGSGSSHAGPAQPSTYREPAIALRDAAKAEIGLLSSHAASPLPAGPPLPATSRLPAH